MLERKWPGRDDKARRIPRTLLRQRGWTALTPRHARAQVAVTASTGIAAIHVSGTTLHSMAGIKPPRAMADFDRMQLNPACERWQQLEVLLIDEVSMVSAELFSALERGARLARDNARPWGGVQLIVCGDFHQLPPISNDSKKSKEQLPEARALPAACSGGSGVTCLTLCCEAWPHN